jgi:uncharacterized protein YsxB (DUF464 family)
MVRVHVVRDKTGFIREYTVEGHAESGKPGKDIVCASVSAIAYTGANALEELAGIKLENTRYLTVRNGYMKCVIPSDIPEEKKNTVKIILDTIVVGFQQLEYTPAYKKYISILDEEV